jgi:homoserine acetyltransferase
MNTPIRLLLSATLTAFVCSAAPAQQQKFAELGEFTLVSGEVIQDCRIGYRTFGSLNADKSNVILFPTWAGGTTEELQVDVGPKGMVNRPELLRNSDRRFREWRFVLAVE